MIDLKRDLSIVVSSCDKNAFLLKNFATLFAKYFEAADMCDKYIITANVDPQISDYNSVITKTNEWTDSVDYTLSKIQTPYVLFLLDDFYFYRRFELTSLERALSLCKAFDFDKYIFHYPHIAFNESSLQKTGFGSNIYKVDRFNEYTMTTQISIWNVSFFKQCLLIGENPWQFEIDGTSRVNKSINHNIYIEINDRYYLEAMSRGNLTPEYYNLMQIENLK